VTRLANHFHAQLSRALHASDYADRLTLTFQLVGLLDMQLQIACDRKPETAIGPSFALEMPIECGGKGGSLGVGYGYDIG
jgi:hypothetical protein